MEIKINKKFKLEVKINGAKNGQNIYNNIVYIYNSF